LNEVKEFGDRTIQNVNEGQATKSGKL